MRKYVLMIILVVTTAFLFAAAGSKGYKLLNLPASPIIASMGNTGELSSNDAFSILGNPVASASLEGLRFSVASYSWFGDVKLHEAGILNNNGACGYGFVLRYVDYGKIEERDEIGTIIGDYSPMDANLNFNLSKRIFANHYFGLNTFLIYEKIDISSSFGYGVDFGYKYTSIIKGLTFGATIKNIGFGSDMDNEKVEMPTTYEASINYERAINSITWNAQLKEIYFSEFEEVRANVGTSISMNDRFFLRTGYKFNYDNDGFSGGFGVKIKNISVDYSYLKSETDLDDIHMFGVSLSY